MSQFGDFVTNMLDTADDIPSFLAQNQNFAPADLLRDKKSVELLSK
jgi:hypothetical protein